MRQQYLELDAVGGLTVGTSSLNLMKEFRENQEVFANNLKNDIQNGLTETLHAFHVHQNQENIDPNTPITNNLGSQFGQNNMTSTAPPYEYSNNVNQVSGNPSLQQILNEM